MNKFTIIKQKINGVEVERIEYFNEHWYKIDKIENPLPSVTAVIGDVLSKGYGFEQWLRDTGNESKLILREAGDSGSKLHDAIEQMIKGHEVTAELGDYDIIEWKKLNQWHRWFKELNATVLDTEFIVYNDYSAGTVDCLVEIDGKKILIDWKTGNNLHESSYIQVGGAYFNMYGKADEAWIVHIGAKNKAGIKVEVVDTEKYTRLWKNISNLHKDLFPNKKAPTSEFPLTLSLTK